MSITANSSYEFEITSNEVLTGAHPKSGLLTAIVSGVCTNADGVSFDFIATNNLDQRYPERFKVNWNGSLPRLPKHVGHGLEDERKAAGHKPARGLYMTRGARIAIALRCKQLWPRNRQLAAVAAA